MIVSSMLLGIGCIIVHVLVATSKAMKFQQSFIMRKVRIQPLFMCNTLVGHSFIDTGSNVSLPIMCYGKIIP